MASSSDYHDEDRLLRAILNGTASETGEGFFRALVKNLSQALGTYGAWVTTYLPQSHRLRALAFWLDGRFVEDYEYEVAGTPCERLLREKSYLHIPERVIELFPRDADLAGIEAVSYIGFPLLDEDSNILGNIAVVDIRPMPDSFRSLALFRIFAARATAELLRLEAETEATDREEQLRGIFEGALDAIVKLDRDFNIIMMNPSARTMFAIEEQSPAGGNFNRFLVESELDRLTTLINTLKRGGDEKRNIWIPGGLTLVDSHAQTVRTEATLSQLEVDGGDCFVLIIRNINERYEARKRIASLKNETRYLRNQLQFHSNHDEIIGRSKLFMEVLRLVSEVAPTDSTVLIYGETGTGKEVIARLIHAESRRRDRPLITVNCAAIPDSLMESEFFGHEKGAFTGATQRREGRFSLADGGTIFLDEVGELNMEMQSKLLRVLQEGEFAPVGSSRNVNVDVRIVAATNRDLSRAIVQGTFRTDLFYRLHVFPVTIPPLRDRPEEIGPLADHFIEKFALQMGKEIAPVSDDILEMLQHYHWPGNIRELQNVIERGVITARHGRLNLDYALPRTTPRIEGIGKSEHPSMDKVMSIHQIQELERQNLLLALQQCGWRVAGKNGAAQLLSLPPSTLQSRMKSLGITRPA